MVSDLTVTCSSSRIRQEVLILVVMEDGLWLCFKTAKRMEHSVLILVVMEDGLWLAAIRDQSCIGDLVLILVVMEDGLWHCIYAIIERISSVLILVVMEDGRWLLRKFGYPWWAPRLNPCCNGKWTQTPEKKFLESLNQTSLNPCCNGRWSLTNRLSTQSYQCGSLNPCCNGRCSLAIAVPLYIGFHQEVLILVVMEDGLWRSVSPVRARTECCLNPCCNGRWSLTSTLLRAAATSTCLNPCCNGRWSLTCLSGTVHWLESRS